MGGAGRIAGKGLIDIPHQDINYKFSYSPAVGSSITILAAFAINPIAGAAALVISKVAEPAIDAVIRVDFTVIGPIKDPEVKLVNRETGKVKLTNLEEKQ